MVATAARSSSPAPTWPRKAIPGINVVAANASLVKNHPEIVQAYVCATPKAEAMVKGAECGRRSRTRPAPSAAACRTPTKWCKLGEAGPIGRSPSRPGRTAWARSINPGSGIIAQVLYKTGLWMKEQGKIQEAPSQQTVSSYVDASFAQNVIDNKCPQ